MSKLSRRTLLKSAAAASTAFPLFTIAGTKASGRVIGANDTIRVGVAGINGRGTSHMDGFASQQNVDVTYLIDPDSRLFESRAAKVKSEGGNNGQAIGVLPVDFFYFFLSFGNISASNLIIRSKLPSLG